MTASTQAGLYLATQQAILISDARHGKDCNCVCLDCGRALVAVTKRSDESWGTYFRHMTQSSDQTCNFSGASKETALHLIMKAQVAKSRSITVPPIYVTKPSPWADHRYNPFIASKSRKIVFDKVLLEKRDGSIIPDCIGFAGAHKLLIEIKVTHGVGEEKREYLKKNSLPCVEFYAQDEMHSDPQAHLDNSRNFEWIHENLTSTIDKLSECDNWFMQEDWRIEGILEREAQERLEADNEQRGARMKRLFGLKIREWDKANPAPSMDADYSSSMPFSLNAYRDAYPSKIKDDTFKLELKFTEARSKAMDYAFRVIRLKNQLLDLHPPSACDRHLDTFIDPTDKSGSHKALTTLYHSAYEGFIERFCTLHSDNLNAIAMAVRDAKDHGYPSPEEIDPIINDFIEATFNIDEDTDHFQREFEKAEKDLQLAQVKLESAVGQVALRFTSAWPGIKNDIRKKAHDLYMRECFSDSYAILESVNSSAAHGIEITKHTNLQDIAKNQIWSSICELSNHDLKVELE